MKISYSLLLLLFLFACTERKAVPEQKVEEVTSNEIVVSEFQSILDSAEVMGSVLIYDLQEDQFFSNDFQWAESGKLPASTFKIPNSIVALETSVVEHDSTVFKWNGEERSLKVWEQDLEFRDAFRFSCVPCYQEVARRIGAKRMNKFLDKLDFGSMQVDSTNIDLFWLQGASRISSFQQIDFLKRLYTSKLPISKRTERILKRMMVLEEKGTTILRGKTGWSISDGVNNGWFVGYLETRDKTYFFASNVAPKQQFDMDRFPGVRREIVDRAFTEMGIVQ